MQEEQEVMGVPASPSLMQGFAPEPVPVSAKGAIANALLELAERCEKATGPDDALTVEIACAATGKDWTELVHRDGSLTPAVPRYTALIDAAATLVPEGLKYTVSHEPGRSWAFVGAPEGDEFEGFTSATPALALCAEALRARAASAIDARSGETACGLDPKDESAA